MAYYEKESYVRTLGLANGSRLNQFLKYFRFSLVQPELRSRAKLYKKNQSTLYTPVHLQVQIFSDNTLEEMNESGICNSLDILINPGLVENAASPS
jgi:hypothetical protein